MAAHLKIIEAFWQPGTSLTINKIAKNTDLSYGSANKYVHELIHMGVLNETKVGPSLLCTLNYSSPHALASLVFISMQKAIPHGDVKKKNGTISLLEGRKKIFVDKEKLSTYVTSVDFEGLVVLSDHELFWTTVAEVFS